MRYAKSIRSLKSENQTPAPVLFKVQKTETLPIVSDYITLSQFLKAVNVISTGGEAKFYLSENVVKVNGEPDQRRGRKLRPGDLVIAPGASPTRLTALEETGNIEEDVNPNVIQNPKSKIQNGTAP